ncbi:MAG: nucleotidyltransferase domain-containing protein [Prevotella sp.]|nr:nucleotidyltransferase domain-containing protein [Prevotella sp.]
MMDIKVSQTIREYFKTQPIEKAWVFGSFSRGEEQENSDVDIMVSLIPGTRLGLKFFAMNLELEQLLQRPVDLVIEGDLLPFAEKTASHDKVLVYARA